MAQIDFGHNQRGHLIELFRIFLASWLPELEHQFDLVQGLATPVKAAPQSTAICTQAQEMLTATPTLTATFHWMCQWVGPSISISIPIFGSWLKVPPLIYWNVTELCISRRCIYALYMPNDVWIMFYFWPSVKVIYSGYENKLHTGRNRIVHTHIRRLSLTLGLWLAKLAAGSHRNSPQPHSNSPQHARPGENCTKGQRGEYARTTTLAWRIQSKPLRNSRSAVAIVVAVVARGISQRIVCAFCRRALGSADEFRSRRDRVSQSRVTAT